MASKAVVCAKQPPAALITVSATRIMQDYGPAPQHPSSVFPLAGLWQNNALRFIAAARVSSAVYQESQRENPS
ncbi:hypothetical protein [Dickeya dadantii]|uniref:Uncharacterized protein n=1 Tax=Dickeya dadantii (strain 3937) TaxID=198628 RepID=E0SL94_DICD3|nr:hypothetical protein [Dickeya dadantii]ADM99306.1 hypothetical protein Dda3937_02108 [Dickeya dadantii 3937]